MDPQRILITAALPYANGPIHLGHLAGAYLPADMYARFQRLKGRTVAFICGSDEHGVAITMTAENEKTTPQAVVDRYHAANKAAFEQFGMSFDNYSRTSVPMHHDTAREFLMSFHSRRILLEKEEQQFYDVKAGMFLPDRYVEGTCPVCDNPDARGDQCERCGTYLDPVELKNPRSKISGAAPELRTTTHLYFPLGKYQDRIGEYINQSDKLDGWKENVLQYCRGWLKDTLPDRAVTRDLEWGVKIPLPGYEHKVLYVWFDAVLGYISATREWSEHTGRPDEWKKYWINEGTKYVAFIGKDNVVFHCIVFPAMLMAWNDHHESKFILPMNVPANEFLNFEGQKFSKSRGWGIDVQDMLAKYPVDPLRYYLAVTMPENRDSDFYWRDFQAKNNNELADIVGNFVNRTMTFAHRSFSGEIPKRSALHGLDEDVIAALRRVPGTAGDHFEHYRFREAVLEIMNLARVANKYFNDSEPWNTVRTDPDRCATTINVSLQIVRALSILLSPVIPFASEEIWKMLNLTGEAAGHSWDFASELMLREGHKLGTAQILFTKIEDEVIESELQKLTTPPATIQPGPGVITLDDFKKVDLRVAKIVECERLPKSEKLLKLQVEVGAERRQILAGIAQHYAPENLVGKLAVVVFNLKPVKLMGQESQGMLLAASNSDGKLTFITPSTEIESGSIVK